MKEAIFLLVAVTAFTAAIFVPGTPDVEAESATVASKPAADATAAPSASDTASFEQWSTGQTTLQREGDGHFYADVDINGRSVHALVDTGASMVALTGADARALGLYWTEAEIQVVGTGASGPVMGVPVMLDRVELDRHEAHKVQAVILPDGLQVTLLGQSFLSTIDPVRIENDRMVLGR